MLAKTARAMFHTSILRVESFEQLPSSSGRVTSKLLCAWQKLIHDLLFELVLLLLETTDWEKVQKLNNIAAHKYSFIEFVDSIKQIKGYL